MLVVVQKSFSVKSEQEWTLVTSGELQLARTDELQQREDTKKLQRVVLLVVWSLLGGVVFIGRRGLYRTVL